jgi:hypothetical protein
MGHEAGLHQVLNILDLDLRLPSLQKWEKNSFVHKPLSLWYFLK